MKRRTPPKAPPGDLGFGAVVANQSRYRLLNHDGSFNVRRHGLPWRASLSVFHSLVGLTWTQFLAIVVTFYLAVNALFALGYVALGPQALNGPVSSGMGPRFEQAFFFSVQSFSTVGYGHITPVGRAANSLVTIEAIVGMISIALVTGLVFARFSRPVARIFFSEKAVVGSLSGIKALKFRIANLRKNQIIELQAKVIFSRLQTTPGSERPRRVFFDLPLERRKVTFFPLSWTIVHPIDEESPLHGLDEQGCLAADVEILVLLTGTDETFSQTVHARSSYKGEEIAWGAEFVGVFRDPTDGGPLSIDMHRLGEIKRSERLDTAA
ncbi:MAG: ion channel [Acidobacteriota bacterium]|nr:ion channel [Acidobacteriota bacterium]